MTDTLSTASPWPIAVDSIDPEAALNYTPWPDMYLGYPVVWGQGERLPGGVLAGWQPEDFTEARSRGKHVARIANLTPDYVHCVVADVEAGALTYADARTFVTGREGYQPGSSTVYASLSNWPAVGQACRGRQPSWAWVAFWPAYPDPAEVAAIQRQLEVDCPGTKLAAIQYRNLSVANVDLSVIIDPAWAARP